MNISILGCGWLGLPLGRKLVADGHTVSGSTTTASKLSVIKKEGITPFLIDLKPYFINHTAFFECDLLVLNIPPRNRNDDTDYHAKQLKSVITTARRSHVERVIFVSSTAVYPSHNEQVTEQDACYDALSRSGISLLAMEDLFRDCPDFSTTILRMGGLYGPDRHPGRFLAGKKNLSGGGNPVNMVHLHDCIGVIQTIIQQQIFGDTFNVCSPAHPSRKAFYEQAAKVLSVASPEFSDEPKPFKLVSSEKLIKKTGYQFLY